jgi:hypothetical protein
MSYVFGVTIALCVGVAAQCHSMFCICEFDSNPINCIATLSYVMVHADCCEPKATQGECNERKER